ncbi:hypothetical protein HBI56_200140 [Parastagonospora nodorum]|uniref:Zn(2)-C6 fungal-type domain-containing protein n=2 Tax=Phaeosphaeria nodorum (strain SN15 / ATCC MYA-4574 / FGSC 10173) TaxID=321614 RepID=A0A7U2EXR3_PHANO|nr:hypothetical protein SNOG_15698 [Parastagonospora nodorum SN15]KAH3905517.1 hypothetical protein HBH56_214680 [Parastagonospora nodorum]EAT77073.1 hypothetical protein SNOG_15698 [Parastagonospora nodorum SN15]KAH3922531.1 hypothetical protein HBH54_222820 [Parastagonospora nodorum]KAH3942219.1 hypothetical protein HBH53_192730 [Parastagonospora nodorum]KAH3961245.1 hypothetical protein HBH51_183370 [Parastagonospora nodorum]
MANAGHDEMPPRPECEFDFNLPHGIDAEEDVIVNQNSAVERSNDEPTLGGSREDSNLDPLFFDDTDSAQQPMNYDSLPKGFSDDEGEGLQFDRSCEAEQARKPSPKSKKSPRRSNKGDVGEEASPRAKRPRQSLFGGPVEEAQEPEFESNFNDQDVDVNVDVDMDAPEPSPDFRHRMSSLNLDQQEENDTEAFQNAQDDHPFDLGLGLGSFEQDDMLAMGSRAASEDSFMIPQDDRPVYELRQNIDRAKTSTYIDTDKTGNYDPAQEAKIKALKLQKAKAMKAAKKKSKGKGKAKVQKEHVPKYIVRLRFKAFGNVRNYTNDEDNWPVDWSEVDTDYEQEANEYKGWYRHETPGIDIQIPIEDPQGSVDDITGYPAARGCKQCRINDKDCTMVAGGSFPCDECEEEDTVCEPIIKPVTKGRCKQCDHDDEDTCSFEDNPGQSICDQCTDGQFVCEALPPLNYKAPRISIDEILYGPNRKHVQCTFCRAEKKRCSLKKKTDKPPCNHCKNNSIGCTFYDIPKAITERQAAAARKKALLHPTQGEAPKVSMPGSEFFSPEDLEDMMRDDDTPLSREPTPELDLIDNDGNKGLIRKVKTSFAHPVEFNQTSDCNFCELPMFGCVGEFEREVYVIKWHSGLGYTEVGGGHREDKDPTRMCKDCTMARAQIILCDCHTYERMPEDTLPLDFAAMSDDLMYAEPGSAEMRYQLSRWCSMCFSPAKIGCCTTQLALNGVEDGETRVGCGLRLCDNCRDFLQDGYNGNLEEMAEAMDNMPKASAEDGESETLEGKPRADVGYLLNDSLLMRCIMAEGYDAADDA